MAERRIIDYKRRRRIRRLKARIFFILLLCGAFFLFLRFAPYFDIRYVDVTGISLLEHDEIVETADVIGLNIMAVPTRRTVDRLKGLTYLEDAKIRRSFPAKVIIEVEEEEIYAFVKQDETYYYTSRSGTIMQISDKPPEDTSLEILGVFVEAGDKNIFKDKYIERNHAELFKKIEANGLSDIVNAIILDNPHEVSININQLEIQFGPMEDIDYKLQMLIHIVNELGENTDGVLDLRNGNKAYFRAKD